MARARAGPAVRSAGRRVVVTGMGCVTPSGVDVDSAWASVLAGRSAAGRITRFDPDDHAIPVGIACEVQAEPELVGVAPKDARRMDRVLRYALAAAHQAVADAKLDLENDLDQDARDRVMVAIGSGVGGVETLFANQQILETRGARRVSPFVVPYSIVNMPSGLVAIQYRLGGPNLSHSTACATSTHAIGECFEAIARGAADRALAGGVESPIVPLSIAGFGAMRALSPNPDPSRASRPFDAARDGFVLGEGGAVVVLEAEEVALARGAEILAVVEGYGASADGFHLSAPDAEGRGAIRCMRAAIDRAGLAPVDVDAVNAHATATPAGDVVEAAAIRSVFADGWERVPVSATKGATGHLLGAAGAIEAIFCVRSLREQVLPPTANLDEVGEGCELDHVVGGARPAQVTRILSNSFGFGGTNGSLLLAHPDA